MSPDEKTLAVAALEKTDLKIPAYPEGALGSLPIGVAFPPNGKSLYVACAGTSSLTVFRAAEAYTRRLLFHQPFPLRAAAPSR